MTGQLSLEDAHKGPQFDGLDTEGTAKSFAVFSPCRGYRYLLGRSLRDGSQAYPPWWFGRDGVIMVWCMLNPSTADAFKTDPTVTKCLGFAARRGCAGILIVNLAAWRTPHPAALAKAHDPTGRDNARIQAWALDTPHQLIRVAAWGRLPPKMRRLTYFERPRTTGLRPLWCYGVTTASPIEPRHPLMLAYETPLKQVYSGTFGVGVDPSRASHVHVFRVDAIGVPWEIEDGCPVAWLTREEFLAASPFAEFYRPLFGRELPL